MWIITVWQCFSPDVTVQGFWKCCISNTVDETDDDMMWNGNDDEEDIKGD